jgi:glutamine phosphoribosylpyrophosphate amidotransferase
MMKIEDHKKVKELIDRKAELETIAEALSDVDRIQFLDVKGYDKMILAKRRETWGHLAVFGDTYFEPIIALARARVDEELHSIKSQLGQLGVKV